MSAERQIENIIRRRFAKIDILESSPTPGEERLMLRRRNLIEALKFLRSDPDTQLDLLVDISAILHLNDKNSSVYPRLLSLPFFEIFYILRSTRLKYRVRISIMIPEDLPSVPTISGIFQNASWLEREMWDLHGVYVEGHAHLQRLIMYPAFAGHPLRKEYPLHKAQPMIPLKVKGND